MSHTYEAEPLFATAVSTTTDPYSDKYAVFNFHDRFDTAPDVWSMGGAEVRFESVYDFPGWDRAQHWIFDIIQRFGCADVLEVGSGANPTVDINSVYSRGLRYTANDVSATELNSRSL